MVSIIFSEFLTGQIITPEPKNPTVTDSIQIYFDATEGNQGLMDYAGEVYAHTGLIMKSSSGSSDWKNVIADWDENKTKAKLDSVDENLWKLDIGHIKNYYGNSVDLEKVERLAFVFRNSDGTKEAKTEEGGDILQKIYHPGIHAIIDSPQVENTFGHPMRNPIFKDIGDTIKYNVETAAVDTENDSLFILKNGNTIQKSSKDSFVYKEKIESSGAQEFTAIAQDTAGLRDTTYFGVMVNPEPTQQAPPAEVKPGINYMDDGSVVLALFAPYKEFVYAIGAFSDWKVKGQYFMKEYSPTTDSTIYWIRVEGLESNEYYGFQYLINGEKRIADPYTELILDPNNDKYIEKSTFPNLPSYPQGKTEKLAGVIYKKTTEFNWTDENYQPPAKENLVIYECLLRDFIAEHNYETLRDTLSYFKRLGINAIELMPINEFEGNLSWGYNPSFYFAPDKYYGSPSSLKKFINACHENNIAVLMDIVLNHAYSSNSMVRMYWENGQPSQTSPWFNQTAPHTDFSWGYDFDHQSKHTQAFVNRVNNYWVNEFHIDGYRFDFTRGFTNKQGSSGEYDASRINILKRMSNQIWQNDSTTYVILEHLVDENSGEMEKLADHGILLWGNLNHSYTQLSMGYQDGSDISWGYYDTRGWEKPNLITYMESHDEERMMYKNITWGNKSKEIDYNVQNEQTALNRVKLAATLFFTYPGPKMIWQFEELGYDISIEENGRTGVKPIKWEYYDDVDRKKLFKTFQSLIKLRKNNSVFTNPATNVKMDTDGLVKKIKLSGKSASVIVIGNIDVNPQTVSYGVPYGGTWYEFFSGDSLKLNSTDSTTLSPGEYHIISNKKFFEPDTGLTEIRREKNTKIEKFKINKIYPNPFNSTTQIEYNLKKSSQVRLKIYNIKGREIYAEELGKKAPGQHYFRWQGKNNRNMTVSAGIYFLMLYQGDDFTTQKLTFLK